MIHHQRRRDLAASAEQPLASREETPESHHDAAPDTHATPAEQAADRPASRPAVPRQERRPARDAYDLYAQIYAIRTEDHTS